MSGINWREEQSKPGAPCGQALEKIKPPRMNRLSDLTGRRFDHLTAIEPTLEKRNGYTVWRCQCDCGRIINLPSRALKNSKAASCRNPECEYYQETLSSRRAEDLTGQRFGKLVVLGPAMITLAQAELPAREVSGSDIEDTGNHAELSGMEDGGSVKSQTKQDSESSEIIDSPEKTEGLRSPETPKTQEAPKIQEKRQVQQGMEKVPRIKRNPSGNILWKCQCNCGNYVEATSSELKRGYRKSCGCLSRPPLKDWIGHRFGKLTVTAYDGKRKGVHFWRCICDCGNETVVCQSSLKSGHTTSCGCQAKPIAESRTFIDGTCVEILRSALMKGTIPKNNSSAVRGVYWDKKHEKWVAQITFKGKTKYLGSFKTVGEARVARKQSEERYFGEFLEAYDAKIGATVVGSVGALGSVGAVDAVGAVSALGTGAEADLGAAVDVHSLVGDEAAG